MKKIGATFEYENERNRELLQAFYKVLDECPGLPFYQQCEKISQMPSSRFWVSEERATIVIIRLLKGLHTPLSPCKREMYDEILRRVIAEQHRSPHLSIRDIVFSVVLQPAPKFYYTAASIREMIYRIKREWYEARKRKLRHLF